MRRALAGSLIAAPIVWVIGTSTLHAADDAQKDEPEGLKASFISGTYVMEGRCEKLKALEAGGPKNVATVPEMLTAEGFRSWEGSCDFLSIAEIEPGKKWRAEMDCVDGGEEWKETDTFTLDPATGAITVVVEDETAGDETSVFIRCDGGKGT